MLAAVSLQAASETMAMPMGLPCDSLMSFPCSRGGDGGWMAQTRSKAPVVVFELRYRDADGKPQTARQAIVNENPGQIIFAAFRVGMYQTKFSAGTEFVSLRIIELAATADEIITHLGPSESAGAGH